MTSLTLLILLLQLASTLSMVGLIWFVQIVHYPLFSQVGRDSFRRYEMEHQRLTTLIVVPLMLLELFSSILMVWYRPPGVDPMAVVAGIGLLAGIWLVTFAVQVPQHTKLILNFDRITQQRLVLGNWLRTVAWSLRGALVLWMVWQMMSTNLIDVPGTLSEIVAK